jgi:hypothetical protein
MADSQADAGRARWQQHVADFYANHPKPVYQDEANRMINLASGGIYFDRAVEIIRRELDASPDIPESVAIQNGTADPAEKKFRDAGIAAWLRQQVEIKQAEHAGRSQEPLKWLDPKQTGATERTTPGTPGSQAVTNRNTQGHGHTQQT